jgi:hypothetical protein
VLVTFREQESHLKTRRSLHDLDLARIAPLAKADKRIELAKLKDSFPPYGYKPFRLCILDILNVEAGPLAALPRTPWASVAEAIRLCGKSPEEIKANLRAAEGLFNFATDFEIVGRRHEFFPLAIGLSEKVSYWSPVVLSFEGHATVPFFDPRKSNKLTPLGRRFALSAMHERIRVSDPDFADVRLAVFQFANSKEGPRTAKAYFADDLELFDYSTMDEMVRETYAIWTEILEEREAAARKAAGLGPIFGSR